MSSYPYVGKMFADYLTQTHATLYKAYVRGLITHDELKREFCKAAESVNTMIELLESKGA